jgi:YVTN family beta-propeller protein
VILRLSNLPLAALLLLLLLIQPSDADDYDRLPVGVQPDGRIVVPTNQVLKPAGLQITFPGRPVDLAFAEDGKILVVKNNRDLVFLDVATNKVRQTLPLPQPPKDAKDVPKPGFGVVGLLVKGDRIYAGDAQESLRVAVRQPNGQYAWGDPLPLARPRIGGLAHPSGIAFGPEEDELWVASTRGNNVQRLNVVSGEVEQAVPVGVAPFALLALRPDRLYVTNWGGDRPNSSDPQGKSAGTPIHVDPKTGVADRGSVSVLGPVLGRWKQLKSIPVGLHPCGMAASSGGKFVYVANAHSDTVSVIDTDREEVVEKIACRPEARLPFGSGPNALALSSDGGTLYVANGTNNCLAVVRLGVRVSEGKAEGRPAASTVAGFIPTGWFPAAVRLSPDGKKLYVANVKGHGSLNQPRPADRGRTSSDFLGSISVLDVPNQDQLAAYTREVNANNRLGYSLNGLDKPRPDAKPMPVPLRHGEPSLFKHVIYVIKENRTYDQVFGDVKEGNGDPNLVLFGEKVTPNHHALAREFTLFDNFYCSGAISADGHTWTDQAYVGDYIERSFGGWTRSYPDDGSDPLAYAPTGFLWDNALAHKKTLRNYGEHVKSEYLPKTAKWIDLYRDYQNGTNRVKMRITPNTRSLAPHTHPVYPWFPLLMPDVYRARLFLWELKEFEKKGEFPNLLIVTLPCDHTSATRPDFPTPRAMVADNDLALGQIVEGVSKSKFWKDTCIFVVEDDPQNGFDHVDGHRTVALVISPYTRRQYVDHTNYNQTGMVKTIELILGLPPMNQFDLSATPMRACFQDDPDLTPYACRPNRIPLDEMNWPVEKLWGKARYWAEKSLALNLDEGDAADEDTLNRILWHATRGYDVPYPEKYAGGKQE